MLLYMIGFARYHFLPVLGAWVGFPTPTKTFPQIGPWSNIFLHPNDPI